ncbi:MAG: DNA methyltransferase [Thermomicrobiales bacterium]
MLSSLAHRSSNPAARSSSTTHASSVASSRSWSSRLSVASAALKELEKEVVAYGTANGLPAMLPHVGPRQLYGLEINEYAHELAQVVVWIGYLQWMTANGFQVNREPVLEPMETVRLQDALLDRSDPANPKEATWPEANFIVGNPPFLGGNRIRQELGDEYLGDLFRVYEGRVPRFADLCCYFFEKARDQIEGDGSVRAGLLATNAIRGGVNREAPGGSRSPASYSWRGTTNRGFSTVLPPELPSSASTMARSRTVS